MAEITKIGNKFCSHKRRPWVHYTHIIYMGITQQTELESCSRPLYMGKSCSSDRKKNLSLGCRVFVYVSIMAGCLCISGLHSDDVIIPWEPANRADFVAQSFIGF